MLEASNRWAQERSVTRRKSFSKNFQKTLKFSRAASLRVGKSGNGLQKIFSENPKVPATDVVKEQEDAVPDLKNIFKRP
jgi:hypothetical protein